jgi:hypothetical protein
MLDNHDHPKACEDLGFLDFCGLDAVAQICEHRHKGRESPMIPSSPLPNYPKLLFDERECLGAGSEESKR